MSSKEEKIYRDFSRVSLGASAFEPIEDLLDARPAMRSLLGQLPSDAERTSLPSNLSSFGVSSKLDMDMLGEPGSLQSSYGYQQKVEKPKFHDFGPQQTFSSPFASFAPSAVSFSASLQTHQLPELDPAPVYFEKYSSFYSRSRPEVLLSDLHRVFSEMEGVDHDLCPAKCKIKGFANGVTGRCAFKVQLFWSVEAMVLCEFQRRSGCVVSFNKFWKRSLTSLTTHAPILPDLGISHLSDVSDLVSLPPAIAATTKPILERATIDRLVAMAGCGNVDVQREGSAALATISQVHSHSFIEVLPQLLPLLRKLMLANDDELCRNACVFLANLCFSEICCTEVVSSLLSCMLNLLKEPGHLGRRDSKRHIARALFECSKTPCGVCALRPHVSLLQGYRDTQDSALQGSIRGTLERLQV